MNLPSITDPFFRQLYKNLAEEIDNRSAALIRGAALTLGSGVGIDATTTAIKYAEQVSYIQALSTVLELGLQLDHERYNNKRNTDNDDGD